MEILELNAQTFAHKTSLFSIYFRSPNVHQKGACLQRRREMKLRFNVQSWKTRKETPPQKKNTFKRNVVCEVDFAPRAPRPIENRNHSVSETPGRSSSVVKGTRVVVAPFLLERDSNSYPLPKKSDQASINFFFIHSVGSGP